MSQFSQGTKLYFIDPADDSVQTLTGVTSFNPGGSPADQLDDTSLEDLDKKFKRGMRTPGQASVGLKINSQNAVHKRLHALSQDDTVDNIKWAVGWSDGTEPPTVTDSDFVLPDSRTWFTFDGYVADFPFDFQLNSLVSGEMSIQRSGGSAWTPKASS
ncbi:phage tail tube protein [uncultured Microbulbifer sp.]|uniref:phage tail tube protein n=1 Tax=uncultured Microbulbifer sp. TaxID=348147 RepID=UPI00260BED94|nr:phage tail tube protein [uncultured Microbulbifer sp.]